VTTASPTAARADVAQRGRVWQRARGPHADGSRRAVATLVLAIVILLGEALGWAALRPQVSTLAFWTCAACHA